MLSLKNSSYQAWDRLNHAYEFQKDMSMNRVLFKLKILRTLQNIMVLITSNYAGSKYSPLIKNGLGYPLT